MKPTITEAEWFKKLVDEHPEIKTEIDYLSDYTLISTGSVVYKDNFNSFKINDYLYLPDDSWMRMRIREKGYVLIPIPAGNRIQGFLCSATSMGEDLGGRISFNCNKYFTTETEWMCHVLAWLFTEGVKV